MTQSDIGIVELKACPFPHEAKRGVFIERDHEDFFFVRVSCADCGCAGPYVPVTGDKVTKAEEAQAIAAWNARDPIITEMVEALERVGELIQLPLTAEVFDLIDATLTRVRSK